MQKEIDELRKKLILAVVVQAALIVIFRYGLEEGILSATILLILEALMLWYAFDQFSHLSKEQSHGVSDVLSHAARDAYLFGETGIVIYNDEHVITWVSDLFTQREISCVGEKVLSWLPDAEGLLVGNSEKTIVVLNQRTYEVTRKNDEQALFFKDITDLTKYRTAFEKGRVVIGMASLDNYEESTQYEDESVVSNINIAVRTPFTEYCKKHGILVKRVNNYRYFMVLNERIYKELSDDHFSVLTSVRKAATKQEVSITLSMAFARGWDSYEEMDDVVAKLMDLAQSRGGDQVAVQKSGEDVKYFGGSSEAAEKSSRVRVRVMAHTLRELVSRSSNVIICCHRVADFDCMGAALGMARMTQSLNKPTVIIAKTGGIEEKLEGVLNANLDALLEEDFKFVTENEALNQLKEKTLVIMVDHHNIKQSNGAKVLEKARTVAVIDHHRRSTEMGVQPVLVYIEAGASSTCELITEMIPYVSNRVEISELDANIMLAGMIVDTQRFRVRTGARTFDAASTLRKYGADPLQVDDYLKDTYAEFESKTSIMKSSKMIDHDIIITPVKDRTMSRSMMSQIADDLLQIQDVEASFVIANDGEGQTCISARSNGHMNVQRIMEKMHGGGHMTASAMQRPEMSIDDVEQELLMFIKEYIEEEKQNESNSKE